MMRISDSAEARYNFSICRSRTILLLMGSSIISRCLCFSSSSFLSYCSMCLTLVSSRMLRSVSPLTSSKSPCKSSLALPILASYYFCIASSLLLRDLHSLCLSKSIRSSLPAADCEDDRVWLESLRGWFVGVLLHFYGDLSLLLGCS